MPNSTARFLFPALVLLGLSIGVASQTSPKPLLASQVLALQAGGVLPANVAHEIGVRGLNFHPDDDFRAPAEKIGGRRRRADRLEFRQSHSAGFGWKAGQGAAETAKQRAGSHPR